VYLTERETLPGMKGGRSNTGLLDRARLGEAEAIAALYERYAPLVYRIAFRLLQSEAEAEDVLQDVFLGLPRGLRTYEARGSLENWIKRVAARTALLRLRARGRKREVSIENVQIPPRASVRDSPIDRLALEAAVARLPDSLRTVFVLKDVEGYSHVDIGRLLGISTIASRTRLHRARKLLRKALEGLR
jgi:RNA polymerase sigma-70 factor (ECF subfamily)